MLRRKGLRPTRRPRVGLMSLPLLRASLSAVLGSGWRRAREWRPQLVKLTYLDGVSNYGPRDAQGVLEFSFAEAYAALMQELRLGVTYGGMAHVARATAPGRTIVPGSDGVGVLETELAGLAGMTTTRSLAARTAESAAGKLPSKDRIPGASLLSFRTSGSTDSGDIQTGARPSELPDRSGGRGEHA